MNIHRDFSYWGLFFFHLLYSNPAVHQVSETYRSRVWLFQTQVGYFDNHWLVRFNCIWRIIFIAIWPTFFLVSLGNYQKAVMRGQIILKKSGHLILKLTFYNLQKLSQNSIPETKSEMLLI